VVLAFRFRERELLSMDVTRRSLLLAATGVAAVIGTEALFAAPATAAPAEIPAGQPVPAGSGAPAGRMSPNGWPIATESDAAGPVWTRPLVGTGGTVEIAIGDAELILLHVARRFHYEIDTLRPHEVIGFRKPAGLRGYQLNHASGSAIDIRPGHYPVGVRGGFFPAELEVIRDILADCGGLVRWGGDFGVPDEAHFELTAPPTDARVRRLAAELRQGKTTPGAGAGVIQNPQQRTRRERAVRLQRRQSAGPDPTARPHKG
jgi:hypothetical protein